jgi:predicted enzyme related to lactoylglutathione lyase
MRTVGCAATIYVLGLEPMTAFYRGCFALEVTGGATGEYQILESAQWSLALVRVPEAVAARLQLTDPPRRREETPIKLAFDVPSIDRARSIITELGGRVEDRAWELNSYRHCDFVDPEGNVGQLRAPAPTGT